jgi:hypothetical protein
LFGKLENFFIFRKLFNKVQTFFKGLNNKRNKYEKKNIVDGFTHGDCKIMEEKPKVTRDNIAKHLIEYQLNLINKTLIDTLDDGGI